MMMVIIVRVVIKNFDVIEWYCYHRDNKDFFIIMILLITVMKLTNEAKKSDHRYLIC